MQLQPVQYDLAHCTAPLCDSIACMTWCSCKPESVPVSMPIKHLECLTQGLKYIWQIILLAPQDVTALCDMIAFSVS